MEALIYQKGLSNKTAARHFYNYLNFLDPAGVSFRAINYGFDDGKMIPLNPQEQAHCFRLALYNHLVVASGVDLKGKRVLETAVGRGAGASYIARHFRPKSIHGIDISERSIEFDRDYYHISGLTFSAGDAEGIGFAPNSFDAVLDVESFHYYPHPERAIAEAYRALDKEGYYLVADMVPAGQIKGFMEGLKAPGFRLAKDPEDITENVVRSLQNEADQKEVAINNQVPLLLRPLFQVFAGQPGTFFYNELQAKRLCYLNVVLQK